MLEVLKQPEPVADEAAAVRELWVRARRPERDCDQVLSDTARHWLRRLPPRQRPRQLCIAHPRVANRIAWCWHDAVLSAQVLEDLLEDRRGGRRGFAPAIVRELLRLRELNAQPRVEMRGETLGGVVGRIAGVA